MAKSKSGALPAINLNRELTQASARIHYYDGAMNFNLQLFGNELAVREGYKVYDGLDAIRFYLMKKYCWLPRDVKAMSFEDLRFAMAEEMHGWTIPLDARDSYPNVD